MTDDREAIKVSSRNWRRLNAQKRPGDTFDDVVDRLLDEHDVELAEN